MENATQQFGIISKETSMIVTDTIIVPTTLFSIATVVGGGIISHNGEASTNGKYTATVGTGSIQFVIKNTIVDDEETYTCTLENGDSASVTLQVDGMFNFIVLSTTRHRAVIFNILIGLCENIMTSVDFGFSRSKVKATGFT